MPTCAGSREGVSASREVRAGRHLAGSSALKESVRDAKDVPFLLLLLNQPLALHPARLVSPSPVVELGAHDRDLEAVLLPRALCWCAGRVVRRLLDDGEEPRGGRDDEALVLAVEDEVASGEEHLARARHDRAGGCDAVRLCCHGTPERADELGEASWRTRTEGTSERKARGSTRDRPRR